MTIDLRSPAFEAGELIPQKYTGDGENISPPLEWSNLPEGTQELALVVDDPDAPRVDPFVHWVLYHLPPTTTGLPEGMPLEDSPASPSQAVQGENDFGNIGYGGPAPPVGHGTHHYRFHLYALAESLSVEPGWTKRQLVAAIEDKLIGEGELIGLYER